VELGFFGGTFTGLPGDWPERFLALAAEFRDRGVVGRVRCSTRPDAADPDRLARLAGLGLDMVELGVQSFDDAVLAASGRGYTGADALAACAAVREAGMDLGVQLLPGLPGEQRGVFERDVAVTAGLRPQAVRIYPCLVLDGTPLAGMLRAGTYRPWTLARTVWAVGAALVRLWAAAVPVIRIGLAPEPGMQVLAGPVHPALGQLCRSEALYAFVRGRIGLLGWPPAGLLVPRRWMSEFRGHGSGLVPRYARLGLAPDRVRTWDRELFVLW
jgi:histone acetyltransferase (RNA polymerase elongator complex component)